MISLKGYVADLSTIACVDPAPQFQTGRPPNQAALRVREGTTCSMHGAVDKCQR